MQKLGSGINSGASFVSLKEDALVSEGDIVEDLSCGREVVSKKSYYSFLLGHRASEARKLNNVYDIVRAM